MSRVVSFSTDDYGPTERERAWSDHIRGTLFDAAIQSFHPAGLRAESYARRSDDVAVFAFRSNEHSVQRTPDMIDRTPQRSTFVSTILTGSAVLYQPGGVHIAAPGEALVYSPDSPYLIAFQPGTAQLFLEVPVSAATEWFGTVVPAHASKVDLAHSARAAGAPPDLTGLAAEVVRGSGSDARVHEGVDDLLALIARLIAPGREGLVLTDAKRFVAANATDPELLPAAVADHVHLSTRQLNRLFGREGRSIAGYLAEVRTAHALRLLDESPMALSDVAAMSGFGSVSTLQRHLRRTATEVPGSQAFDIP